MSTPVGKFLPLLALAATLSGAPMLAAQSNSSQSSPQPAPPAPGGKMQTLSQAPADQASASTQSQTPLPPFEVATIKASNPGGDQFRLMFTADGVSITGIDLAMIIREAFNVEQDHVIDEPAWAKSSRFDIEAKVAPDDAPKLKGLGFARRKSMLVQLLVDRFGLKYHRETRELPVYELVIAKGGLKMQLVKEEDPSGARHFMMFGGPGKIESKAMKVDALAHVLSQQLGRTIIDKTGLTGEYDFTLSWTPDQMEPGMAPPGDAPSEAGGNSNNNSGGPSLFTAIEEQLGLKLVSAKGPEDVIVIDQIEQPTAN